MPDRRATPRKPPPAPRRKTPPLDEAALYKARAEDHRALMNAEKRKAERARLENVRQQNHLWSLTLTICVGVNLLLILAGLFGLWKGGM